MKKILTFLFITFFVSCCCIAQSNVHLPASFKNLNQSFRLSCEDYHGVNYKGELNEYKKDFQVVISFCVDPSGIIINLNIENADSIPKLVKEYASKVVFSTNGKWNPEIQNCKRVLSDTIHCLILFRSKKITDWERINLRANEPFEDSIKALADLVTLGDKVFDKPNQCFIKIEY